MTPIDSGSHPRSSIFLEHPRNSVVDTLLSYGRAQTFMSGSNLASTPSQHDVFDDEDDDPRRVSYSADEAEGDDEDDGHDDWEREPLVRTTVHEDEELVMDHPEWNEAEEPPTPTAAVHGRAPLSPPPTSPSFPSFPSRPRTTPRVRNYHSRTGSRSRFISNPTLPSTLDTASAIERGQHLPRLDSHPSSAPTKSISKPLASSPSTAGDETTPLLSSPRSGAMSYTPTTAQSSETAYRPPSRLAADPITSHVPGIDSRAGQGRKLSHASARRPSMKTRRPGPQMPIHTGSSTWGQTLFNSIAILLGIGMLSEPLAFSCAGWIGGTILIIFYGFLTCYTAKILGGVILSDPRLRTYADIGQAAFGPRSNIFTSTLFCLELFAVSVILIILYSDSLHAVMPAFSSSTYKIIGLFVIIPTSFLPLRVLSFASVMGILSTLTLIFVVFFDGATKLHAPGSLWDPAPTEAIPVDFITSLPISFGLFMAGFAGHAVIPSLVRDMQDPREFKSMMNWAFFVATTIYALIGMAGYRMFGRSVSDEVSQDLLKIPGFSPFLNKLAVWMLVVSPLTKFSLSARPMNVTLEILLGIEESTSAIPAHNKPPQMADARRRERIQHPPTQSKSHSDVEVGGFMTTDDENPQAFYTTHNHQAHLAHEKKKAFWRVVERTGLAVFVVVVSIYVPDFSTTMAFLGAFSAFMLCVIGPLAAKMALEKRVQFHDAVLITIATVMAAWGTYTGVVSA